MEKPDRDGTMFTIFDIIHSSNSFEQAYTLAKKVENVPAEEAEWFWDKYGGKGISPKEAFRKLYDEVKAEMIKTEERRMPTATNCFLNYFKK